MPAINDIDPDLLPASVRDMAEVIGLDAALGVVQHYGGTRLWLPLVLSEDHPLVQTIGLAAARSLSEHYRLESLTIPTCKRAFRVIRNQRIVERYRAGETAATLAHEFGLHERMIWQIVAREKDHADKRKKAIQAQT